MKKIKVNNLVDSYRIDQFLNKKLKISRSKVEKLISEKLVWLNGELVTKNGLVIKQNDLITIDEAAIKDEVLSIKPYNFKLDIIFEDENLLVINKPKNILTHPDKFEDNITIANAFIFHAGDKLDFLDMKRPGIVHRLDKNTTGLMVLAKNQKTLDYLQEQIKRGNLKRKYMALVNGIFTDMHLLIKAPLQRSTQNQLKMVVSDEKGAKPAITEIWIKEQYQEKLALIDCVLHTGRTHQIRAHMSYLHHPIFNDSLYGSKQIDGEYEQFLHSYHLEFIHPVSKKNIIFNIELPDFFKKHLDTLKR